MFARIVNATSRPGQRDEIMDILTNELLPLLKRQRGFVDVVGLAGDTSPDDGVAISFWTTKADADTFYATADYRRILDRLKPLMENMTVHTFNVQTSTFHKLVKGRAA